MCLSEQGLRKVPRQTLAFFPTTGTLRILIQFNILVNERQTSSPYVRCALHRFKGSKCVSKKVTLFIGFKVQMRVEKGDPVHRFQSSKCVSKKVTLFIGFRVQNAPPIFEPCYLLFLEATYHRLACIKFNTQYLLQITPGVPGTVLKLFSLYALQFSLYAL